MPLVLRKLFFRIGTNKQNPYLLPPGALEMLYRSGKIGYDAAVTLIEDMPEEGF